MRYGITLGALIIGVALAACDPNEVQGVPSDTACNMDYAAIKAAEMIQIETGLSIYTRFVVEKLSEDSLSEEEIASLDRMQAILDSRKRPVDGQDISILTSANLQLTDPLFWDRADDRKCRTEDETVSLYCALYFGSINTIGEFQHRRTALQEVRFAIEDATGGRDFEHRLMDFNNLPKTSFDDIKGVLKTAAERVQDRLDLQAKCALQL
jgi:hypothetical protein